MAQRAWLLVAVSVLVSIAVVGGLWLGFGSGGGTADGYGLSSWGDDCAGTPATSARCSLTMEADKTVSATFAVSESEPLSLIVVSDGSHDSLLLEWTGGPANATKWQYRQRRWENMQPLAWEAWTDVPGSGAATRSYRLGGLRSGSPYDHQVRAVSGSVSGPPSPVAETGTTHEQGALPQVFSDQIVEGDGRTRWRIGYLSIAITIPDGVRLVGGGAFVSVPCATPTAAPPGSQASSQPGCPGGGAGTSLKDFATGSILTFSYEGVELNRHVVEPVTGTGAADTQSSLGRSVHDLFDQLIDSVKVVPQ